MSNSLLPVNESQEQRDLENITLNTLSKFDTSNLTINPLKCDVSLLPHLALLLDVNIDGFDEEEQRLYLKNAREIKKYAGTVYAVRMAANSIFDDVKVLQWFDYGGVPNKFKLDISAYDKPVSIANVNKVKKLVETAKRKSSHLESIDLSYKNRGEQNISCGAVGEVSCIATQVGV